LWLIVGLGNPGPEYARSRHNIGFLVIEKLSHRVGRRVRQRRFGTLFTEAELQGRPVTLIRPLSFMNASGRPVKEWMEATNLPRGRLLIIHDDIDLPFGRIKIVARGGHGGHRGVQSVQEEIGTTAFPRVRVGIGRPQKGREIEFVLSPFDAVEVCGLREFVGRAADAVEAIVARGVTSAMNRFNVRPRSGMQGPTASHEAEEVKECESTR
jgi:PTH1 family peptidyl-tRNA hydrolase